MELLGYRDSGFDGELPPGSLAPHRWPRWPGSWPGWSRTCARPSWWSSTAATGTATTATSGPPCTRRCASTRATAADGGAQLYEHCLPNALMRRWLEEMRSLRPATAYHSLDPADLGRDDAEITDVVDVSAVLERREAAMAEHRSQASPFDGLSDELRRAFLTADHLVRVAVPACHGGRADGT